MEKIKTEILFEETTVLFAPHQGRKSGKVIPEWLAQIKPRIIVIGAAPSEHLDYYQDCNQENDWDGYQTITQNTAGDIVFETDDEFLHIFTSKKNYKPNFTLLNKGKSNDYGCYYIGSISIK
jgi:UDP-N-acetylmuramate-alanine ligase